jgi:uncharacterized protein YjgD (DUF1641 family)
METNTIQKQIDELNQKLDQVLAYTIAQNKRAQVVEDLFDDLSIVGKDFYDTTVSELDKRMIEVNPEQVQQLLISLLKNVRNFNQAISMMESMIDFARDASPIAREMMIDLVNRLHEFERKGYFEFFAESAKIVDNIVSHFSKEDVANLANNVVSILETIKNLTQPEMLNSLNNAVKVFNSIDWDNAPQYSIWKLLRELGKPEMKKALGFSVAFIKNVSNINTKHGTD